MNAGTFQIRTWEDPKGWAYDVVSDGATIVRGRHHVATENEALGRAWAGLASMRKGLGRTSAAVALLGTTTQHPWRRLTVQLECGHLRQVRPKAADHDAPIACHECLAHRRIVAIVDLGPSGGTRTRTLPLREAGARSVELSRGPLDADEPVTQEAS